MFVFIVMYCYAAGDDTGYEAIEAVCKSAESASTVIKTKMNEWRADPNVFIVGETWDSIEPYYKVRYYAKCDTRKSSAKTYEFYVLKKELEE